MKKLLLFVLVLLVTFADASVEAQTVGLQKNFFEGCPPFTVKFTDTVLVASSYKFRVEENPYFVLLDTFTSGNNAVYTFTKPGSYFIFIAGDDADGNPVGSDYADVYVFGRYQITATADTLCPNEIVSFGNEFSYDAQNSFWNFGDGDTTSGYNLSHSYANAGEYLVSEKITTRCGYDTVITKTIIVNHDKKPPEPYFYFFSTTYYWYNPNFSISTACPREPLVFTAPYTDPNTRSYHWDFGDGITEDTFAQRVYHTYSTVGKYEITLTLTNNCGNTNFRKATIIVSDTNTPIMLPFGVSSHVQCPNTSINFYNWENNDPSIQWNFGDGITDTTHNPSHRFSTLGKHLVTFTATNYCGNSASYTDTIDIVDTITADIPYFGPYYREVCPGDKVLMNESRREIVGEFPHHWDLFPHHWDFGDGTSDTAQFPTHIYHDTGTFVITRTESNACGNPNSFATSVKVTTTALPPVDFDIRVNSRNTNTACPGDKITFAPYSYTYAFVPSPPFEAASYLWDFGDGTTGTSPDPIHYYYKYGKYRVTFTVTNHCGNSSTAYSSVSIDSTSQGSASFYWGNFHPIQFGGPRSDLHPKVKSGVPINFYAQGGAAYHWNFGDGTALTTGMDSIQHSFVSPGTYFVQLTSTNGCGKSGFDTNSITVEGLAGITSPAPMQETNVAVYPNPFNSIITLRITNPGEFMKTELKLCDVLGRVVFQSEINKSESEIDLTSEPSGIYFLIIQTGQEVFSQKLIKQ